MNVFFTEGESVPFVLDGLSSDSDVRPWGITFHHKSNAFFVTNPGMNTIHKITTSGSLLKHVVLHDNEIIMQEKRACLLEMADKGSMTV